MSARSAPVPNPGETPGRNAASRLPDDLDRSVALRIKARRVEIGMSVGELSRRLDLTYQQVLKYEGGTNRINASRLYQIARTLGVSVSYFFEQPGGEIGSFKPSEVDVLLLALGTPEGQVLARAIGRMDVARRRALLKAVSKFVNENVAKDPEIV